MDSEEATNTWRANPSLLVLLNAAWLAANTHFIVFSLIRLELEPVPVFQHISDIVLLHTYLPFDYYSHMNIICRNHGNRNHYWLVKDTFL
jgi:hypothetical protein